ncbi:MAG: hypothetical protein ACT4OE_11250 [Sphingosinicella sp.]
MNRAPAVLSAALLAGLPAWLLVPSPAAAQYQQQPQPQSQQPQPSPQEQPREEAQQTPAQTGRRGQWQRIGTLNRQESEAVGAMYRAVQAQDWAAARAAMPAAQAGVSSTAGRFLVGQMMFQMARATRDRAIEMDAVTRMIDSGGASPEQVAALRRVQGDYAYEAAMASGNFAAVEAQLVQRLEANPNDAALIGQLAEVKMRLNKREEALALFRRAIQIGETSGSRASESLYRRAAAVAYEARNTQLAIELARNLVTAYPSPQSWNTALFIYRDLNNLRGSALLDVFRLQRATQALTSEREFIEYAEAAEAGSAFGEQKFALETGLQRNAIRVNATVARQMIATADQRIAADRPTLAAQRTTVLAGSEARPVVRLADALFGYGDFAGAAALFRAALAKNGADAGAINLRLGAALAMAGNRAEAEGALRAVTGPRAELANFWLLWLSTRS